MTEVSTMSRRNYARVAGGLYILIIVLGLTGEILIRAPLQVSGDAAETARNILAHEHWFRLAVGGDLVMLLCDVGVATILYLLLRPINPSLSLFAAFLRLVMTAISGVNSLNQLDALLYLKSSDLLSGLGPGQTSALAVQALTTHTMGQHVALVFFGVHCFVVGAIVFWSGYLPRLVGVLLAIGGIGYLTNSFSAILALPFASLLFPWVLLPALAGELTLAVALLAGVVNEGKGVAVSPKHAL